MNLHIELHYLPCIAYLNALQEAEKVVLEAHESYQKGSYRNRTQILGSNGNLRLSVPLLQGKNQQQAIKSVKIDHTTTWQRQHFRALRAAYSSAPFWEHYVDKLAVHFEQKHLFLWDWNTETLALLLDFLKLKTRIETSTDFVATDYLGINTLDLRQKITPKTANLPPTPPYPQVFGYKFEFSSNLSGIDALMNIGRLPTF